MKRNILALMMALCMLVSALPVEALADALRDVDDEILELSGELEPELPDFEEEIPENEEESQVVEGELPVEEGEEAGAQPIQITELLRELGELIFGTESDAPQSEAVDAVPQSDAMTPLPEEKPAPEKAAEEQPVQADADKAVAENGAEEGTQQPVEDVQQAEDTEAVQSGEAAEGEDAAQAVKQPGEVPAVQQTVEQPGEVPAVQETGDQSGEVPAVQETGDQPGNAEDVKSGEALPEDIGAEMQTSENEDATLKPEENTAERKEAPEAGETSDTDAETIVEAPPEGEQAAGEGMDAKADGDSDENAKDDDKEANDGEDKAADDAEKNEEKNEENSEENAGENAEDGIGDEDPEADAQQQLEAQAAMEALTVSQASITLAVGETAALTSGGGSGGITWTSENPGIAAVDANGVITAVAMGATRVVATDSGAQTAACEVNVVAAFSGAVFESNSLAIGLGEVVDLSAFAAIDEKAFGGASLSSSNPGIASVGADGKVTGAALGEARITANCNGQVDAIVIAVKPAPAAISLPYKTLRIGKGDRVRIRANLGDGASTLTCTSGKKKVVGVSKGGIVRGLKKGTAIVTVRTFNGLKARVKVVVKGAPGRITPAVNPLLLGVGETYTLTYKTPKGTAGSVKFTGDNPAAFSVNAFTGEITGIAPGAGNVTLTSYNGRTAVCPVTVLAAPTSVGIDPATLSVAKKKKIQLKAVFNEGAWANATYQSLNPRIAKVSQSGMVTGLRVGQAVIRVTTYVPGVAADVTFTVMGPPSRVWLDQKTMGANVGQPFKIEPRIPAGSKTTFKFKSSNRKIATVSKDGVVTPKKKGKVKITITTHNKKKCTLTLKVANPGQINQIKLNGSAPVLFIGDSWQVPYVCTPATATPALTWTSSNTSVAVVDAAGVVTAVGYGQTTIKAVPAGNKKVSLKFTLSVQTRELTLDIPARTTDVAGIPGNLAMIDNIRKSALSEIARLQGAGTINGDSAARRTEIVNAIFTNYAFPWMTPSKQNYWKAANSENGAKDFKPDRVYYGLPYISGSGANRRYSVAQALAEQRYTDSGMGYYVLNKGAYLNGKYVGNDCSGLVDVSIWGFTGAHSADRTADIAVTPDYKTVSFDQMLPGDLINKGSAHVVMFLYYASSDKSKIMIIENGGSEKGTNTVHCSVMTASAYKKSGYKVRRLAYLD